MSAGSYAQNLLLQYLLLGSTGTRVTTWSVGLSLGSPSQASLSEVGAGSGYARKAVVFLSSNINTFTNTAAITFGAFSTSATMSGCFVVDSAGDLLLFGTLSPATAPAATSVAVFASGALKVVLS